MNESTNEMQPDSIAVSTAVSEWRIDHKVSKWRGMSCREEKAGV